MRPIELKSKISINLSSHKGYSLDPFINPEIKEKKRIPKTYFSRVIQEKAGITESQIRHWTVSGVLKPFKYASGTGKMHVYDHQNLIEAKICKELNYYTI
ncbi:MAG: MerR family transcriptional regulator, partial [Smithellaceae bacterium]|nr:MerR family transcriptional regulator [Smithellaceae bacterium]